MSSLTMIISLSKYLSLSLIVLTFTAEFAVAIRPHAYNQKNHVAFLQSGSRSLSMAKKTQSKTHAGTRMSMVSAIRMGLQRKMKNIDDIQQINKWMSEGSNLLVKQEPESKPEAGSNSSEGTKSEPTKPGTAPTAAAPNSNTEKETMTSNDESASGSQPEAVSVDNKPSEAEPVDPVTDSTEPVPESKSESSKESEVTEDAQPEEPSESHDDHITDEQRQAIAHIMLQNDNGPPHPMPISFDAANELCETFWQACEATECGTSSTKENDEHDDVCPLSVFDRQVSGEVASGCPKIKKLIEIGALNRQMLGDTVTAEDYKRNCVTILFQEPPPTQQAASDTSCKAKFNTCYVIEHNTLSTDLASESDSTSNATNFKKDAPQSDSTTGTTSTTKPDSNTNLTNFRHVSKKTVLEDCPITKRLVQTGLIIPDHVPENGVSESDFINACIELEDALASSTSAVVTQPNHHDHQKSESIDKESEESKPHESEENLLELHHALLTPEDACLSFWQECHASDTNENDLEVQSLEKIKTKAECVVAKHVLDITMDIEGESEDSDSSGTSENSLPEKESAASKPSSSAVGSVTEAGSAEPQPQVELLKFKSTVKAAKHRLGKTWKNLSTKSPSELEISRKEFQNFCRNIAMETPGVVIEQHEHDLMLHVDEEGKKCEKCYEKCYKLTETCHKKSDAKESCKRCDDCHSSCEPNFVMQLFGVHGSEQCFELCDHNKDSGCQACHISHKMCAREDTNEQCFKACDNDKSQCPVERFSGQPGSSNCETCLENAYESRDHCEDICSLEELNRKEMQAITNGTMSENSNNLDGVKNRIIENLPGQTQSETAQSTTEQSQGNKSEQAEDTEPATDAAEEESAELSGDDEIPEEEAAAQPELEPTTV